MKIKSKNIYIILSIYIVFIGVISLSSTILAKYVSSDEPEIDFTVGSILYFDYERSDLYRNNKVVPVTPSVYTGEDGEQYQLLEAMNIVPGDALTYHFYVSNFNNATGDQNIIDGVVFPNTIATLSLINAEEHEIETTISYREVPYDETDTTTPSNNVWNNLVEGNYLDLPPVSMRKVKYEFKVTVVVDNQISGTTHVDYVGAVLTLKVFVNAASDQ